MRTQISQPNVSTGECTALYTYTHLPLFVISFLLIKVPFMLRYVRAVLSILALILPSPFMFTPRYLKFVACLRLLPSLVMLINVGNLFSNIITFDFSSLFISFFFAGALLHISIFFCRFCLLLAKIARTSAKAQC